MLLATLRTWLKRLRPSRSPAGPADVPASLLAALALRTSDSMVLTDARRRVVWVNEAFTRRTGYTLDEARGRSPGALLQTRETDALTVARLREALDAALPIECEVLNATKVGEPCWFQLRIEPQFDRDGRLQGFVGLQIDISKRVWSEMALRSQQALYEAAARVSGTGAWELHLRTGRLSLTDAACRVLGCDPDAPPDIATILRGFSLEALAALDAIFERGLRLSDSWELEVAARDFNGAPRWLRLTAECEFDDHGPVRILGGVQDVTRSVALQEKAHQSAQLLQDAIDCIEEAFVIFDADDRLVWCNDRYRALYAISADLLVPGQRFEDIIRGGAVRGQYPMAIGREEEWVAQRLAQHRDGNRTVIQQVADGRVLRIVERHTASGHHVGFRVDITELVRATEAAEQADRAKGEFIATISHELRTPLQSILGFSDLGMHFAAEQPPFDQMFKDIHSGGQRMLRLVNGLLDVSKLDHQSTPLHLKHADLMHLSADVARELEGLAEQRRVRFVLPDQAPVLPVQVDVFRLSQVVRNVLANAIRFAPEGSTIEIAGRDLLEEGVELTVRDHGPGIPVSEQDAIFEAFIQSSRTRDGSGGTGLGLTISRKIMQAHGGRISARQPTDGLGGACLQLWLPPAPRGESALEAAPRVGSEAALRAGGSYTHPALPPTAPQPPVDEEPSRAARSLRGIRAAQKLKETQVNA